MRIVLNGKEIEVTEAMTVFDFLQEREIESDTVVVELNREIVPGEAFGETRLNDGDHLEVLRFVGGG